MTAEPIQVAATTWNLRVDTAALDQSAAAWRSLADAATARMESLVDGFRNGITEWVGDTREAFAAHRSRLNSDLVEVAELATDHALQLDGIVALAGRYQDLLDSGRSGITGAVQSYSLPPEAGGSGATVFLPEDEDQAQAVRDAVKAAGELRTEFDDALAGYRWQFQTSPWRAIADRWADVAAGDADPFRLPLEATNPSWLWIDGRVVVNAGHGDNDAEVTTDPDTGEILVDIDGTVYRFPPGTPVTVRTGAGDDTIEVDEQVGSDLVLIGGGGNDRLRSHGGDDVLIGLGGKDDLFSTGGDNYVSGGGEVDYLELTGNGDDRAFGGDGDDAIYALDGDNRVAGGDGDDYLITGDGNDTVDAGDGDDVMFTGGGSDVARGGGGDDVHYSGRGRSSFDGGSGDDTAYRQSVDHAANADEELVEISDAGDFIADQVDGSPEFTARVEADLALFEASPTGQQMLERLEELQQVGDSDLTHQLTISELENDTENFRPNEGGENSGENGHANRGGASPGGWPGSSSIEYNPSFTFDHQNGNPATVLYHEMAHVYSYWNGNYDSSEFGVPQDDVSRAEYQAVGLPFNQNGLFETPDVRTDPEQPSQFTENGWREENGRPERTDY